MAWEKSLEAFAFRRGSSHQTEDGQTRIEVQLLDETVWLSQAQMCELFDKDKRTISEHIQNIFEEGELQMHSTVRNFRTVQMEGSRKILRQIDYYNLDVIISIGYHVRPHRGIQFRIWATATLKMTARDALSHLGKVSHEAALNKARSEYMKYQEQLLDSISPVEWHFLEAVKEMEQTNTNKDSRC